MTKAALVFPHQLFEDHPALAHEVELIVLVEEPLFIDDPTYPMHFHKQKLWLHRATMKRYAKTLRDQGHKVIYRDHERDAHMLDALIGELKAKNVDEVFVAQPHDFILAKRLKRACDAASVDLTILDTPQFLNTADLNRDYREGKKRWFMADFYKWQRKRLAIMVDGDGEPEGERWSFDEDNRKKVPRKKLGDVPYIAAREADNIEREAMDYVDANWSDNPGSLDQLWFPTDHAAAQEWLDTFLNDRFHAFGDYEDAIVREESWLWHSVLTPMLNVGLLTPCQIMQAMLEHCDTHDIPINAREGFVRQIIGWREFMRATYDGLGVSMRTTNHWNHTRSVPPCFWDATTGIAPVDDAIERILKTGYCHHIERLMVLGGFMFVCEFDPDDIYRWFMEMFVDSYDWVMVPNVYAMSQNADGGQITTKPYFSGSNYIKKMSNWTGSDKEGDWAEIWDGLYWRWIDKHADALEKNPRWSMMVATARKMNAEKMQAHKDIATAFLRRMTMEADAV